MISEIKRAALLWKEIRHWYTRSWLKYLGPDKSLFNRESVLFWKGSNSNPCRSRSCPVPRRINIGSRYQAEVPELRQRSAVELDHHRAELVWTPLTELEEKPDFQQKGKTSTWLHCCYITLRLKAWMLAQTGVSSLWSSFYFFMISLFIDQEEKADFSSVFHRFELFCNHFLVCEIQKPRHTQNQELQKS